MADPQQPVRSDEAGRAGDRLATDLLRIARDPVSGRIRHRRSVDICLRAALFADLAARGHIVDEAGAPALVAAEPTGDRILDAVCDAVLRRPGVAWPRWFRHVSADGQAIRGELVAAGRWQRRGGWRPSFVDEEADAVLARTHELDRVARYERAPADEREAVLATLTIMCGSTSGWPRPGAVKKELASLVGSIPDATLRTIVHSAATTMRRTRRGGSVGGRRPVRRRRA
jgi:hypothetical protein